MKSTTINQDVLQVLSAAVIDGQTVRLTQQLERKLYQQTNDVLMALGGKWNRKAKGHVFATDPADVLDHAILTGRYERQPDWGYFPTPAPIVARLIEAADIQPEMKCLEPSAGTGNIAEALAKIVGHDRVIAVELQPAHCDVLAAKGFQRWQGDFVAGGPLIGFFPRVVMNPPFARQQDIEHVYRAFEHLEPGGRLVSVMSIGFTFREDRKARTFREFVDRHGSWETLPEEAFKESGTSVRTVMVVLDREAA